MNLTLARNLLQERGYQLNLRDIQQGKRTICRAYAVSGEYERFLCHMSKFVLLSTVNFQYMVAQLPKRSEAEFVGRQTPHPLEGDGPAVGLNSDRLL